MSVLPRLYAISLTGGNPPGAVWSVNLEIKQSMLRASVEYLAHLAGKLSGGNSPATHRQIGPHSAVADTQTRDPTS